MRMTEKIQKRMRERDRKRQTDEEQQMIRDEERVRYKRIQRVTARIRQTEKEPNGSSLWRMGLSQGEFPKD